MTITHPGVDVAATHQQLPYISLILGILSVPGSILTWDTASPARASSGACRWPCSPSCSASSRCGAAPTPAGPPSPGSCSAARWC